jgi:hypothetical protein
LPVDLHHVGTDAEVILRDMEVVLGDMEVILGDMEVILRDGAVHSVGTDLEVIPWDAAVQHLLVDWEAVLQMAKFMSVVLAEVARGLWAADCP